MIILVDLSAPAPQGTLKSMVPEDPIEPVAEWTWGALGNGFVYVSPRQLGGGEFLGAYYQILIANK